MRHLASDWSMLHDTALSLVERSQDVPAHFPAIIGHYFRFINIYLDFYTQHYARPEQDIAQGGPWGMSSVQVHLNSQATRRRIYLLLNTLNNK